MYRVILIVSMLLALALGLQSSRMSQTQAELELCRELQAAAHKQRLEDHQTIKALEKEVDRTHRLLDYQADLDQRMWAAESKLIETLKEEVAAGKDALKIQDQIYTKKGALR